MQCIFRKENVGKARKYRLYRHLQTFEKIIKILMSFYIKNSHITQSQIALMLDCSERKVKRLMKMMQEDGMIERVGVRRSGQWIVK